MKRQRKTKEQLELVREKGEMTTKYNVGFLNGILEQKKNLNGKTGDIWMGSWIWLMVLVLIIVLCLYKMYTKDVYNWEHIGEGYMKTLLFCNFSISLKVV